MPDASFWTFHASDAIHILILIATIVAIYRGPIKAVQVAREEQNADLRRRQQEDVYASLMKTRRFQLDPQHVSALNLIQVYFSDVPSVLTAYKNYIRLLYRELTPGVSPASHFKERDDAFIDLVFEIARSLGTSQDKKEIEELAYSPRGWADDQETVRKLHHLLIELLENRRAMSVTAAIPQGPENKFPPPPQ